MKTGFGVLLAMIVASLLTAGCGGGNNAPAPAAGDKKHDHEQAGTDKKDEHSQWWCVEHSVPEEICGQCSGKLAAEFQKKGDWCKLHDRPDSQCFICHPEYAAKFIAQYEAKYGMKPPKPTEQ